MSLMCSTADCEERAPGGQRFVQVQPGIKEALEQLVDPLTRGDPMSPLRWTCKSKAKLAAAMARNGWKVSATKVGRLLHELGYSLRSVRKSTEGAAHPDRNAQFEHINAVADDFLRRGSPVISVDTKKKELVGNFKNAGQEWRPAGHPEKVLVHDFPGDALGQGRSVRRLRQSHHGSAGERRQRHVVVLVGLECESGAASPSFKIGMGVLSFGACVSGWRAAGPLDLRPTPVGLYSRSLVCTIAVLPDRAVLGCDFALKAERQDHAGKREHREAENRRAE
jgi:hypothetical protein